MPSPSEEARSTTRAERAIYELWRDIANLAGGVPREFRFAKVWTATFGYAWESFEKNDCRTDRINPFLPGVASSTWLGNDSRNYTAHIITATLGYQFK